MENDWIFLRGTKYKRIQENYLISEDSKSIVFNGFFYRWDGLYYRRAITSLNKASSLHRAIWIYYNGDISECFEVHHKDCNSKNNDIGNLELMRSGEHQSLHGKLPNSWPQSEECKRRLREQNSKATEWHQSKEGREWHKNMLKSVYQYYEGLNMQNHVKYVENPLKDSSYGKDSAQTNAKQSFVSNLKLTMKKGIVVFVAQCLKLTNMLSKPLVVTNVESKKCKTPEKVYDITVDIDGCYYANGYLVSNSDSARYMANARIEFGRGPGNMTPEKLMMLKNQAGFGPKPRGFQGPQQPFLGR